MLYNVLLVIHILVCVVLIVVVLMQSSKGGGLAGAFGGGGGGGETLFGGHETATFLSKATTYLAVMFMLLSLVLAFLASNRSGPESVIRRSLQNENNVIPTGQGVDQMLTPAPFDSTAADTAQTQQ